MLDLGNEHRKKLKIDSIATQEPNLSTLKIDKNLETKESGPTISGNLFSKVVEKDTSSEEKENVNNNEGKTLYNLKNNYIFIILISVIVILIIILVISLSSRKKTIVQESINQTQEFSTEELVESNKQSETNQTETKEDIVGIQDFTQNTNMKSSSNLDNPDIALKDIYGLSLRVDYTVSKIDTVIDFVNYEKKRGTWGGGIEFYWLDARYKDTQYVVQIPFKYYKQLDDTGIVPVQMEVLRIQGDNNSTDDSRSIVSYMTLDELTLKELLKKKR